MTNSSSPPVPLRLAVLISGGGTTLVNLQQQILDGQLHATVVSVVANRTCRGIDRAQELGLEPELFLRKSFPSLETYSAALFERFRERQVDLVVLGGFLARILIPDDFENRVMNIHPALIPAFCGQGMYGHHVHEAVIARGCKVSGCTVHFCDNNYDEGPIILQRTVPVLDNDDADSLAARVFEAECQAYPEAIRLFAERRLKVTNGRVTVLNDLP
ncbi:phosphoribosylglycinamide formyltransferase [Planctomicrobium piriforme]|uniref:Phosphoribosylglycinamide formyltransferase n=1 Tax=Planctomicrobium piriforme TaxID=1576369 RepID=A0A1I3SCR9_9PLAN|nr:phosphoribosylglycinamide formyltransferase [Planctomicrobium piriforme]SFJ55306.1 phosphoribosylglycinamide formyltransferase-1 [Planctomicrobium piriforme]